MSNLKLVPDERRRWRALAHAHDLFPPGMAASKAATAARKRFTCAA